MHKTQGLSASTAELQALLAPPVRNEAPPTKGHPEGVVPASHAPLSQARPASSMAAVALTTPSNVLAMFSVFLYGTVGLAMGFINKAILQIWPYSNSFLLFQMAATVAIIYCASVTRLVEARPLTFRTASNLLGVVVFYNANVGFALAAVQALSIPVYHVLKRLTPVFVLLAKLALGDSFPPLNIVLSVCTVVAGCILSGAGDLSFDPRGYLFAIVSCVLQSAYLVMVERTGTDRGYTSSEMMVYNAIMSLPVLVLITTLTGEAFVSVPALVDKASESWLFALLFFVSLVAGVLLNYSLFLCTLCTNALTTTIVGSLRSVLGMFFGFFLLGGVKATPLIVIGCITNTAGGVWYTVTKLQQKYSSTHSHTQANRKPNNGASEESVPLKSSA